MRIFRKECVVFGKGYLVNKFGEVDYSLTLKKIFSDLEDAGLVKFKENYSSLSVKDLQVRLSEIRNSVNR